jgi:hypothetical protein
VSRRCRPVAPTALLLFAAVFARPGIAQPGVAQSNPAGQPIHLETGDFRWVPFTVRQIPSEVDCRFQVVQGDATVHVELLPMSEFRAFSRGREHDTMALTPDGRTGEFRRIVDQRGQYAVVVKNARGAGPVTVVLDLRTNLNPADVARTLSPRRRLTVILISFAFFFVTVAWWGRKLLRAARL